MNQVYTISPNPHNCAAYNKKQAKFYQQAAEAITDQFFARNQWVPDNVLFDFSSCSFTLKSE